LSGKTKNSNNNIVLCENDSIVNDEQEVSKMFNEFFINVAKDIGDKSFIYLFSHKLFRHMLKI
jgi:hypothetical protein